MRFLQAASIRELDAAVIAADGSDIPLMSRAVRALAGELAFFAEGARPPLRILTGPGNNGGDGFGIACHLHQLQWPVEIWSAVPLAKHQGAARFFLERAREAGVTMREWASADDWREADLRLPPGTWMVDALLGTGASRAPEGSLRAAVDCLRRHARAHPVFSVDVPTGLCADTGIPFDPAAVVAAVHTLTLGAPKTGFLVDSSLKWTGAVTVLEIGFSPELTERKGEGAWQVLSREEARDSLPPDQSDDHKGSRGHALLIGGSPGMTGSIRLSAAAALRCGCGLVSVLTPLVCAHTVDAAVPEVMVISGKQGRLLSLCEQGIDYAPYQAVLIGPGLRVNPDTADLLRRVLHECPLPLVIDADALRLLAALGVPFMKDKRPVLLTPHPGEMAGLLGRKTAEVQANRLSAVEEGAARSGARVLLKGSRSLTAGGDGDRWLNLNGNSGMATAGCGDVLAGMAAGLLARGVTADRVLPLAAFLHGRAGDLAAFRLGRSAMLAGDVLAALPAVLRDIQGG